MEPTNFSNVKVFLNLLKGVQPPKWLFVVAIILSILETVASLILPLFTRSLVDSLAASSLEMSVILWLAVAFIIQTIAAGFSYYSMSYIGEFIVAGIRRKLWDHVLHLPVPFYDEHESGETMSRVTQDANILKNLVTQHLISLVTGVISIIGAIAILLMIDWKMTLIMVLAAPLSVLILMPLGRKMYQISKSTQDEMATFSANLGRVLAEIRLVKAYHAEQAETVRGQAGISNLFQFGLKEARIQAIISPFMTFVMMFILIILIGYGGVRVASGDLSAGSLVAIIIYMFQIVIPFSQLANFFTAFQKAMGATDRIQSILNMSREVPEKGEEVEVANSDVHFKGVTFSYKDGEDTLKSVTFTAPAGKTTAFVGPSGGGKTTLFALLERFYPLTEGDILLDDKPIDQFSLHSWRSQMGYVSQESPIMAGTIKDNIIYGIDRPVSDSEVKEAATLAHAAEFIEQLPLGYATEVGERGVKLSGGQRQRIAIARALIRNPRILLLDEATSNLDSTSEQLVQEALQRLMKGRTTLVIAHRLSTVVDADQLVVMEKGQVTGVGTHQELLESHAVYRKLAEQQLQMGEGNREKLSL